MGKYTYTQDGRRILNSEWHKQQGNADSIPTAPISSLDLNDPRSDLRQAQEARNQAIVSGVIRSEQVPEPNVSANLSLALRKLDESPTFTGMYDPRNNGKASTSKEVVPSDLIGQLLEKTSTPAGIIERLTHLSGYNYSFIFDDSGSMGGTSDAKDPNTSRPLEISRWEEAKQTGVNSILPLAFVPTENIEVSFLNNSRVKNFSSKGYEDSQGALEGLQRSFNEAFKGVRPGGLTPMGAALIAAFNRNTPPERSSQPSLNKTSFHIYTDGEPNGAHSKEQVQQLIAERIYAYPHNTFSFHSCTNNDKDTEWCKTLETIVPRT